MIKPAKSHIRITSMILLILSGSAFGQRQVTVSEAIDSVLTLNPNILMTRAQVDASRSRVSQATASLLPQLYANAGYTLYDEPNIVTPIHRQGVFPPLDDEIYEANLQLSLPIFDGGRRFTQRRIAIAGVDEITGIEEFTRNELLSQVAEIYVLARQIEDRSLLLNKRLASLHRQREDLRALEAEGRVSKGDLALVTSLIASTKSDSIAVVNSKLRLSVKLSSLVGADTTVIPAIPSNKPDRKKITDRYTADELDTKNIKGPSVQISEARFEKANLSRSLVSRMFWPEITGYGVYSYRTGSDWDPVGEWAVGLKISLPLFTGGLRISKIRESASLAHASEMALESATLEKNSLLKSAYNDFIFALDRIDYLEEAVNEKAVSLQAHIDLYEAGRIPLRDLLNQETELLQLQLERNVQYYQVSLALLQYEKTAGSLTKNKVMYLTGEIK